MTVVATAKCRFFPLGDQALLVEFGTRLTPELNDQVHALCARLIKEPLGGVVDIVPAYTTLAVHYDARQVVMQAAVHDSPFEIVRSWVTAELFNQDKMQRTPGKRVEIPVCYGGEYGVDLAQLASLRGLNTARVIDLHCGQEYRVYMLGFAPGFAYLGGLDSRIATPRRASPRALVPAGSVGIGGEQTGIYPSDLPGGWSIIGRTPLKMFDVMRQPACRLAPGDEVKFVPIDQQQYAILEVDGL